LAEYNISGSEELLHILALDTTTRTGSIAVVRDGVVVVDISGDPALTHGQRLPADLMRALEMAATRIEDIDLLAVAAGPGSFTGLRVGIASMQGLAFARGLKIVPVSTFEALAHDILPDANDGDLIAPWIDAQRGEVFATLYGAGLTTTLAPPTSARPERTLIEWKDMLHTARVTFGGDGAVRYKAVIEDALGDRTSIMTHVPRLAADVGRIAAADPSRAVLPHAVIPVYVRRSDAELARERKGDTHIYDRP
jgi:tRNA threonylcarbamoyladenosine biosynthesis protein TsaB